MASLKAANVIPFTGFLLGNLVIFGVLIALPSRFEELLQHPLPLAAPGVIACVVALAANAFLPAPLKHVLVFWRIKEVLPGHRAFTEFAPNDPRIDLARLKQNCGGQIPTRAVDQNKVWYRLLMKHEEHPAVADAHRRFLALRDMAATTVLLAILFSISAAIAKADPLFYPVLIGLLGIEYLFLRVGAVNEAERLVCNVLARETA
jgi:hypothetical protein